MAGTPYWNTNVARHAGILREVPEGCRDALDVGCGDGLLTRRLAERAAQVTGLDPSAEMIARARALSPGGGPRYVEGDLLTADLAPGAFDFVCALSVLHHLDAAAGLRRMGELLRPGGVLVVVGLARPVGAAEWAYALATWPVLQAVKRLRRASDPPGMPVRQPSNGYREVRDLARRVLPGARFRMHVLARYSIIWRRPR
jgi:SAM-dependent methyltransferase